MAGQRRAAAGAVGHHLVPPVEQALVRDLLQAPPDGFDVAVIIGDIGLVHVHPECHPLGHLLPFLLVLPDGLLALLDEGLDAKGLNLLLAVQAQLFLHLQLHRQAMGVPAANAEHLLALHGMETGKQVLHRPGHHMADVGLAVGGGRPFIEGEALLPLVVVQALLHDAVFLPEPGNLLLPGDKVHVCGHLVVHTFPPNKKSRPLGTDDRGTTQVDALRPLEAFNGGCRGG